MCDQSFFQEEGISMQRLLWSSLAAMAAVGFTAGMARAQDADTIRLGGTGDAKVQSLVYDGDADTENVLWGRRWGGYGGFYRGGFGYRPFVYRSFYRPFYRPFAYRPFFRPFYARRFVGYGYPYASYYGYGYGGYGGGYGYYGGLDGCSYASNEIVAPQPAVIGSNAYAQSPAYQEPAPANNAYYNQPEPPSSNGTYQYDGGPNRALPMPVPDAPAPMFQPKRPALPLDGKLVSIPSKSNYGYAAYGEPARLPVGAPVQQEPATRFVSTTSTPAVRVAYPAYGDR